MSNSSKTISDADRMLQNVLLVLALFGPLLMGGTSKRIPSYAGPYRVTIRRIDNDTKEYESTGSIWAKGYFSSPRPKQKQYVWGTVNQGLSIDDDMKIEIRVSVWNNNQWKRNAFVLKFDHACSACVYHAKSIVELIWRPDERKCPLPAIGRRIVENQTFEAVFPQFPVLPYARYLFTMAFFKGNQVVGVYVADGDATPKL